MLAGIPFFPPAASTVAGDVDNLYLVTVAITAFFALLVVVLVGIFAIKYKDETGDRIGEPIHGSIPLELAWTIIPFIIAMGLFVYATTVYFKIIRPPAETLEVFSTGKRWMWRFQHLDGKAEINELHIPKGRPVRVTFTSEDVIHDLYIPAFRVKADAIPGRYSAIWFEATETGEFHLFCAEYCGTKHSGMIGRVIVMEPNDYQAWLSGTTNAPLAVRGEELFKQMACVSCHLNDNSGRGPSLAGVFGSQVTLAAGGTATADDAYLRESILNPQNKVVAGYQPLMPTFQGQVNEEGVRSLIQYIKSLPAAARAAGEQADAAPATAARLPGER